MSSSVCNTVAEVAVWRLISSIFTPKRTWIIDASYKWRLRISTPPTRAVIQANVQTSHSFITGGSFDSRGTAQQRRRKQNTCKVNLNPYITRRWPGLRQTVKTLTDATFNQNKYCFFQPNIVWHRCFYGMKNRRHSRNISPCLSEGCLECMHPPQYVRCWQTRMACH